MDCKNKTGLPRLNKNVLDTSKLLKVCLFIKCLFFNKISKFFYKESVLGKVGIALSMDPLLNVYEQGRGLKNTLS